MRKWWLAVLLLGGPLGGRAAFGAVDETAIDLLRLRSELADKITKDVLDPILGAGQSHAFADFGLGLKRSDDTQGKSGEGEAIKLKRGAAPVAAAAPPPSDATPKVGRGARPPGSAAPGSGKDAAAPPTPGDKNDEDTHRQRAAQTQEKTDTTLAMKLTLDDLRIVVLHDKDLPPERLAQARDALLSIYAGVLDSSRLEFKPVAFARPK